MMMTEAKHDSSLQVQKEYFALQWRRFCRIDSDIARHPVLILIAALVIFAFLTFLLFSRSETAALIYILAAAASLSLLSGTNRNDFLRIILSKKNYYLTRLLENLLVCLPFLVGLLCFGRIAEAGALLSGAALMAVLRLRIGISVVVPTPFGRMPFEFTRGFRYTWPLIGFAGFLTYIAVKVANFNLGLFALLLVLIICAIYNSFAEPEYFVRVYARSATGFIVHKLRNAVIGSVVLCFPILISLLLDDPARWELVAGLMAYGLVWIFLALVAKYSCYPNQLSLKSGILLAVTFLVPPVMIYTLPAFYLEARGQIRMYLR